MDELPLSDLGEAARLECAAWASGPRHGWLAPDVVDPGPDLRELAALEAAVVSLLEGGRGALGLHDWLTRDSFPPPRPRGERRGCGGGGRRPTLRRRPARPASLPLPRRAGGVPRRASGPGSALRAGGAPRPPPRRPPGALRRRTPRPGPTAPRPSVPAAGPAARPRAPRGAPLAVAAFRAARPPRGADRPRAGAPPRAAPSPRRRVPARRVALGCGAPRPGDDSAPLAGERPASEPIRGAGDRRPGAPRASPRTFLRPRDSRSRLRPGALRAGILRAPTRALAPRPPSLCRRRREDAGPAADGGDAARPAKRLRFDVPIAPAPSMAGGWTEDGRPAAPTTLAPGQRSPAPEGRDGMDGGESPPAAARRRPSARHAGHREAPPRRRPVRRGARRGSPAGTGGGASPRTRRRTARRGRVADPAPLGPPRRGGDPGGARPRDPARVPPPLRGVEPHPRAGVRAAPSHSRLVLRCRSNSPT